MDIAAWHLWELGRNDRGGVDLRCQINLGLRPSGSMQSEDTDSDLFVAVKRAADRVARIVARALEREHK